MPESTESGSTAEQASEGCRDFQPMDFRTLVLSLSSTAMIQVGAIPDPETNKPSVNLALAAHTIEILDLLERKTRGNLTDDEKTTLDDVLKRLKSCYTEVCSSSKNAEPTPEAPAS